ncbi:S-layer homology domain-containing protein [Heyndrickxia sporothermodurans]|uniref:S-layer homology domain-containing protein n=1 Tax=Heyndrickxia sporothermodurans TaxID=46224 RepID=UPI002DBC35EF|nr:S-layer homology domain-containing protein [Heyndrickxia sporothermodurans]MEB6549746.1 S-layer homology domain-containing protein [Heyndrickxia sporothermodurans]
MTKKKVFHSKQMMTALTATAAIPAIAIGATVANADEIEGVVEDTPVVNETGGVEQTPEIGVTSEMEQTPDVEEVIEGKENDETDHGDTDNGLVESDGDDSELPSLPEKPENFEELVKEALDTLNEALVNPTQENIQAARDAHNKLKEIGITLPEFDERLDDLEENPDQLEPSVPSVPSQPDEPNEPNEDMQSLIDNVVNKMNATHQNPTAENIRSAREAIEELRAAGFPEGNLQDLIDQLDQYERNLEPEQPSEPEQPTMPGDGEGDGDDADEKENPTTPEQPNEPEQPTNPPSNGDGDDDDGKGEEGDNDNTDGETPSEGEEPTEPEEPEKPTEPEEPTEPDQPTTPPSNGNEDGNGNEDDDNVNDGEDTWIPTPDKPSTEEKPSDPEKEPSTDNEPTDETELDKDDTTDESNIFLTEDKIEITSSSAVSVKPTKNGTIVVTFDEVTNDNMATIALPLDVLGDGKVIKLKTEKGIEAVPYTILDGRIILTLHKSGELIFVDPIVNIKDIEGNQYKDYIQKLAERGIVDGEQDSFKPNAKLNRLEFATMVGKSLGINESTNNQFSDVADGYVNALTELGVLQGKGDGSFDADGSLTRQQAFTMMGRLLESKGFEVDNSQTNLSKFKDANGVSDYAKPYVDLLISLDIIGGDNGNIKGNEAITKGQMAKILSRTLERLELL